MAASEWMDLQVHGDLEEKQDASADPEAPAHTVSPEALGGEKSRSYIDLLRNIYLAVVFVLIPGVSLGISVVFGKSVVGGVVLLLVVISAVVVFEVAWIFGIPRGNALCYKVLSLEAREKGTRALEEANAELRGEALPAHV